MPRYAILLLALGCLAATTVAADTPAEPATFVRTPKYRSIADALAAAAANPNSDISILAAAVSASGLAIPRGERQRFGPFKYILYHGMQHSEPVLQRVHCYVRKK